MGAQKKSKPPISKAAEVRRSLGMTQLELAVKSKVGISTIGKLEAGRYFVSRRKKCAIARALGVSVDEIFPEDRSGTPVHLG